MKTFTAQTLDEWRRWLERHHDSESEVWLVFRKKHTGVASIAYGDALEEALCFGWVDSLVKRLDDSRYARKFTPRSADSSWSAVNRKRYAALKAAGRLKSAGIARSPIGARVSKRPTLPSTAMMDVEAALRKHAAAWRAYERLPPSHKRAYAGWIAAAKRDDTKARRVKEAVRLLRAGKPLGLK